MALSSEARSISLSTPLEQDALVLRQMKATEELGRLFDFQLDLASELDAIEFKDVLGQSMTVSLDLADGSTRYFSGLVSSFQQTISHDRFSHYRATLSPWLWFLTRTADCRIFQEMTIPDIIKQVFRDHGFTDFEESLSETYKDWEYCVQYRETDFNFVSRLMEQEGIYYYFKHEDGKHSLVLCDGYSSHTAASGYDTIPFILPKGQRGDGECVKNWSIAQEVQSGTYALNDFNFEEPNKSLMVKSVALQEHTLADLQIYDYPGEYTKTGDGETYAKLRIEELQAQFERVQGESNARGLSVGHLFELDGHPRDDQNKEYLVLSATHDLRCGSYSSGDADASGEGDTYDCSFTAVDAQKPYRSRRITAKPCVQGPQTAVVSGKSGEEIWVDKHGRIKVQFHWDPYGESDENSSCWIRVAQHWAGKSWGGMQLPRIGQEVIVEFLEGDPDRPIITGRLYNGVNTPPYKLPDNKTQSGIKSNSSKGGKGFNEIRFEDKKGEEQLYIHAEKDHEVLVKNDQTEHIENNRKETVDVDHTEEIGQNRQLTVKANQTIEIGDAHSMTVAGDVTEVYQQNQSTEVTDDISIKATNLVIEASSKITFKVGQSEVVIESGEIKLSTTGNIVIDATSEASVSGTAGLTLESAAQAELKSPMTKVKGDGMCEISGGLVKIN